MLRAPLEVLKDRIEDAYDLEYVCDVLGLDVRMILDAFEEILEVRRNEFLELEDVETEEEDD